MPTGRPVGTCFAEIDLDSTKLEQGLKKLNDSLINNTIKVEDAYKSLGIKSDQVYDMMRANATAALDFIKNKTLSSKEEIIRAEQAAANKINSLNEQQFGKQTSFIETLKKNWLAAVATIYAAQAMLTKAWNLAEQAAQFEETKRGLQGLAAQYNMTADAVVDMAKKATDGQLSMADSAKLAAKAFALGLDPKQAEEFLTEAQKLVHVFGGTVPDAVNAMERAAATGRKAGLIAYGITVNLSQAIEDYAKKNDIAKDSISGHTQMQIRANIIMEAAKRITDQTGQSQDSTAVKMARLTATVQDLQLMLGTVLVRAAAGAIGAFEWLSASFLTLSAAFWTLIRPFEWILEKMGLVEGGIAKAAASEAWKLAQEQAGKAAKNFEVMVASSKDLATIKIPKNLPEDTEETADAATKAVNAIKALIDSYKFYIESIDETYKQEEENLKENNEIKKMHETEALSILKHSLDRQKWAIDTFYDANIMDAKEYYDQKIKIAQKELEREHETIISDTSKTLSEQEKQYNDAMAEWTKINEMQTNLIIKRDMTPGTTKESVEQYDLLNKGIIALQENMDKLDTTMAKLDKEMVKTSVDGYNKAMEATRKTADEVEKLTYEQFKAIQLQPLLQKQFKLDNQKKYNELLLQVTEITGDWNKYEETRINLLRFAAQKDQIAIDMQIAETEAKIAWLKVQKEITPYQQKEIEYLQNLLPMLQQQSALQNIITENIGQPSLEDQMKFYDEYDKYGKTSHDLHMEWIEKEAAARKAAYKDDFDQAKWIHDEKMKYEAELAKERLSNVAESMSSMSSAFEQLSQLYAEDSAQREKLHNIAMAFNVAEKAALAAQAVYAAVVAIATQGEGDPYTAFARIAAMVAAMVSLLSSAGISFGGSTTSSSEPTLPASTVLGAEAGTGSESIQNSLKILQDTYSMEYEKLTNIYNELRDLNKNITGLVSSILRTGQISTESFTLPANQPSPWQDWFATEMSPFISAMNFLTLGISTWFNDVISDISGSILSGIFGGEVTYEILQTGIQLGETLVSDLINGVQIAGQSFAYVLKKTSGGWFSGDDRDYYYIYQELDSNITTLFTNVFKDISSTLVMLAQEFGMDTQAALDYIFPEININLMGLSGEEINSTISEFISNTADTAVETLFGSLVEGFQQIDEGLYETAIRLVNDMEIVNESLIMTHQTFTGFMPDILTFSENLISLAGDLDKFMEAVGNYYDKFFSEEEQATQLHQQLLEIFQNLNMTLPTTREGYKALVEGLDLTTESGQEAYVTLMQLAETSDKYYAYLDEIMNNLNDTIKNYAYFTMDLQSKIDDLSGSSKSIELIWSRMVDLYHDITTSTDTEDQLANLQELVSLLGDWTDKNISAIEDFYTIQKDAIQTQIDSTNEQIDALNQQLELAKKWKDVLNSTENMITDLSTSSSNSVDVYERLALAKEEVEKKMGLYLGATGEQKTEYASDLLDVIQNYISIGQEAYQRPSTEYQNLYQESLGWLNQIQQDAQQQTTGIDNLSQQIINYQSQIESLNEQIATIDTRMAADIQEFKSSAIVYYQWAQTEGATLYQNQIDYQKEQINQLTNINDTLNDINYGITTLPLSLLEALNPLNPVWVYPPPSPSDSFTKLSSEQLQPIFDWINQEWGTQKTFDEMYAYFQNAKKSWQMIIDYLQGLGWNIPSYQHGIDYVPKTGLAYLHAGEKVISANRMGNYNQTINISPNIIINSSGDASPREIAKATKDEFKNMIKYDSEIRKELGLVKYG